MIYDLGPDCPGIPHDPRKRDYDWVVTYYTIGDWCGEGEAVAKAGDQIFYWDLGHCSCYGPYDNSPEEILLDDIKSNNIHNSPISNPVVEQKVKELLCIS